MKRGSKAGKNRETCETRETLLSVRVRVGATGRQDFRGLVDLKKRQEYGLTPFMPFIRHPFSFLGSVPHAAKALQIGFRIKRLREPRHLFKYRTRKQDF
jgi:hypothetical protein